MAKASRQTNKNLTADRWLEGMSNQHTKEEDKSPAMLAEMERYTPGYDEEYLNDKTNSATQVWRGVDADEYVRSIREGVYAG